MLRIHKLLNEINKVDTTALVSRESALISIESASSPEEAWVDLEDATAPIQTVVDSVVDETVEPEVNLEGVESTIFQNKKESLKRLMTEAVDAVTMDSKYAFQKVIPEDDNIKEIHTESVLRTPAIGNTINLQKLKRSLALRDDSDVRIDLEYIKDPEAFTGATRLAMELTAILAIADPVIDLFFPVTPLNPKDAGIVVSVKTLGFGTAFTREIDGTIVDTNFKNIIEYYDSEELLEEGNRLWPVVDNDSRGVLLNQFSKVVTVLGGLEITTAPIKMGERVDIIGISQAKDILAKGGYDFLTTLQGNVAIESIYYSVSGKDKDDNEVTNYFKKDFGLTGLAFEPSTSRTGDPMEMFINAKVTFTFVGGNIKQVDGSAPTVSELVDIPDGYKAIWEAKLDGTVHIEKGNIIVAESPSFRNFVALYDAEGNKLPKDNEIASKLKTKLEDLTATQLIGYMPRAYTEGDDYRLRTLRFESKEEAMYFTVPYKQIFGGRDPVSMAGDTADTAKIYQELRLARERMNVEGWVALQKVINILESGSTDIASYKPILNLIKPRFNRTTFTISDNLNNLENRTARENAIKALKSAIETEAIEMWEQTGYNIAWKTYKGDKKPTVIIGVHDFIGRYLTDWSDGLFNYVVRTTDRQKRIGNNIIMSFADADTLYREPDIFNFGTCLLSPEKIIRVIKDMDNSKYSESYFLARYEFIPLLPIMSIINVTDRETLVKGNNAFRTV